MEVFWLILLMCIKNVYNVDVEEENSLKKDVFYEHYEKYVHDKMYAQTLDHFNPTDNRKWFQRYSVISYFFKKWENNVFLIIGGHEDYKFKKMTDMDWIHYAKPFQPLYIHLEHRYYGKSEPTVDLSVDNLRYLTSQQAVADVAKFIRYINAEYNFPPDVKWIVIGDGYAGALAIRSRKLYPNLVHAAISSSGVPEAKLNFPEYYKVIYDILQSYSEECLVAVKNGISQIKFLLRVDESQEILNNLFHTCTPIENNVKKTYDVDYFFYKLSSYFSSYIIVQGWIFKRKQVCQIMTDETLGIEVQRIAKVNDLMLSIEKSNCLKISYDEWIDSIKLTKWTSGKGSGARQWSYQQCTEFGLFTTSDYKPQIFGDKYPLDFFITKCQRLFGPSWDETSISAAIDKTNAFYGGFNEQISNVLKLYGTLDIWKPLDVTETKILNNNSMIIVAKNVINSEFFHEETYFNKDLETVTSTIKKLIRKWLGK